MIKNSSLIFYLLRQSLGNSSEKIDLSALNNTDWVKLVDIAFEGGVAALAVDGLQKSFGSTGSPTENEGLLELDSPELGDLKYEWFGSVFQAEEDYGNKLNQASRFASALAEKGVKCRVLKGMSFAQYYSVPEHRECGDCDVYLGEGWAVGNEVAVSIGGRYEFGTYKHSHLFFDELMIENHRYLTSFNGTKQGKKIERLMEQAIEEDFGLCEYICTSKMPLQAIVSEALANLRKEVE